MVNRALIVEKGAEVLHERREAFDKGKGKRPAAEGVTHKHLRRSPKHTTSQPQGCDSSMQRGGPDRR